MTVHSEPAGPTLLPANQPRQFYRGGERIAELRADVTCAHQPEDWVASATSRFGHEESGLTRLPDGPLLRDAIAATPQWWLGSEHLRSFGVTPALLVKLLDAGQRLPVHCHPNDQFAKQHLGSPFGKTEAWLVVGVSGSNPLVYVGFREDVSEQAVSHWVSTQDSSTLVGSLNAFPISPGDTVFIPAGTPHAIGSGVFIVELQQPTDLSITLEWNGFLADAGTAFLGMDQATALRALNRGKVTDADLGRLIHHTAKLDDPRVPLLAESTGEFFRADRLHPGSGIELEPSFGVLVVLEGTGELRWAAQRLALRRGNTVVIPHGVGAPRLEGDLVAVHCRPPRPQPAGL